MYLVITRSTTIENSSKHSKHSVTEGRGLLGERGDLEAGLGKASSGK